MRKLFAVILLSVSPLAMANGLLGDWGGMKESMENNGVSFEWVYVNDNYTVNKGGAAEGSARMGNSDVVFDIDAEQLMGWGDTQIMIYALGNDGDGISQYSGDMQGVSNIEADTTFKLYEAWIDTGWNEGRSRFLFGLYDLNSEFDSMETAGLFIHASQGIGPDFAQSGLNGPSIFPVTSLSMRYLTNIGDKGYMQLALLDGVPGDLNNPRGTHVKLDSEDGLLVALEMGNAAEGAGYHKIALGTWYYSEPLTEDALGNTIADTNNSGVYLLAEKQLTQREDNADKGLAVYGRYGVANDVVNQIASYYGMGMTYSGLFGREDDAIGVAMAIAINSDAVVAAGLDEVERNLELTYRIQVLDWLALQPDIQLIKNPGTDPTLEDATVYGLRTEIVF